MHTAKCPLYGVAGCPLFREWKGSLDFQNAISWVSAVEGCPLRGVKRGSTVEALHSANVILKCAESFSLIPFPNGLGTRHVFKNIVLGNGQT